MSGTLDSFVNYDSAPWYNYRSSVRNVIVEDGVVANSSIRYMFPIKSSLAREGASIALRLDNLSVPVNNRVLSLRL